MIFFGVQDLFLVLMSIFLGYHYAGVVGVLAVLGWWMWTLWRMMRGAS